MLRTTATLAVVATCACAAPAASSASDATASVHGSSATAAGDPYQDPYHAPYQDPYKDPVRWSPLPFKLVSAGARRSAVRMLVSYGGCQQVRFDRARETSRSVSIAFSITDRPSQQAACPTGVASRCVEIVLARPLGGRSLIDVATGSRPVNSRIQPAWCPRLEPGELFPRRR